MKCCNGVWMSGLVSAGIVIGATGMGVVNTTQPEGEMDMEAIMAQMEEASQPDEHHKMLEPLVGEFSVTTKFWMMGEGEPMESSGDASNTWLLGGRFVGTHYTGEFLGKEFEGFGAVGYHKETGQVESVWLDNFGTGLLVQKGEFGEGTSYWVEGEYVSMMGKTKMKNVTKIISDDKHIMEFWEPSPQTGEYVRTGELTYTRK